MAEGKPIPIDLDKELPFRTLEPHELEPYFRRLAESGQITRRERNLELEDYLEAGLSALKLFAVCLAGILLGAVFVLVVWG